MNTRRRTGSITRGGGRGQGRGVRKYGRQTLSGGAQKNFSRSSYKNGLGSRRSMDGGGGGLGSRPRYGRGSGSSGKFAGRGGRGRGRGRSSGPGSKRNVSVDQLDKELDSYFNKDKDVATKRLDHDLESYFAGKKFKKDGEGSQDVEGDENQDVSVKGDDMDVME